MESKRLPHLSLYCCEEVVYEGDFLIYGWLGVDHLVETVDFKPYGVATVTAVHVVTERQDYLKNTFYPATPRNLFRCF